MTNGTIMCEKNKQITETAIASGPMMFTFSCLFFIKEKAIFHMRLYLENLDNYSSNNT